jgi:hypothetical protein
MFSLTSSVSDGYLDRTTVGFQAALTLRLGDMPITVPSLLDLQRALQGYLWSVSQLIRMEPGLQLSLSKVS